MSQTPNPGQDAGVGVNLIRHVALILKALIDGRVWLLLKALLVIPSVLYIVLPDLMSGNPADDIGVVLIATYLFKYLMIFLIPQVAEEYWPEEFAPINRPDVVDVEPNPDKQAESEEPEKTNFTTKAGNG